MDNLTKKDQRDRSKINMHEDFEVKYWNSCPRGLQGEAAAGRRQGWEFGRRRPQGIGGVTEGARYAGELREPGPRAFVCLESFGLHILWTTYADLWTTCAEQQGLRKIQGTPTRFCYIIEGDAADDFIF